MLKDLNVDQARFIALLAKAARMQRDTLLGNVPEEDLGELTPARGEHNPAAGLGFEPLPPDASQTVLLSEAIASLSERARRELYTLVRVGQGHVAARKWYRGLSEAGTLGEDMITAAILEDPDLHDHITKGLYETKLAL
ncbi:DUF3775 domain-containing protein [Allomesorhizobium camelthorni]|uniref:DUF3775 domain-containing protein n=1 Tax=Allomesorhizobium camelthorni TaxID=475069 RepID=A0A6G4WP70_9HYPH|nr:DUF3775 domain-containing protein [Mesorhizobium camelthorni]NGO56178.1 DUF3775 domain-containing protein [Mesorhizobium camelthorni]